MKNQKFILVAGPCLAESFELLDETAKELKRITEKYNIDFFFKASYRKANRSSINSFQGVGDMKALEWIKLISEKYSIKTLTDIHTPDEAKMAANYVDVIQIPAFLARQTDLLVKAGETGKIVNVKKGQFMAPDDMKKAIKKIESTNNRNIWITERGTFFGYHDLVVDFRGMLEMKKYGYPVLYDATHSLQKPSISEQSGGLREYIKPMAFAAASLGIDGIFFETHINPDNALSDSATQLPLKEAKNFIDNIIKFKRMNDEI